MTNTNTIPANLRNRGGNWITGNVGPFQVSAKAFVEESHYGMPEDARISKLWIALPGQPNTVLYDYDRTDLTKNHLTTEGLNEILVAIAKVIA